MIIQRKTKYLKNILTGCMAFLFGLTVIGASTLPAFAAGKGTGFNEFGYNYNARNFVGTGESWSLAKDLPADYLGIYAKDKLVMKWNARWDECNVANANGTNDASTCAGATLTNEWNGNVPGGSGDTEHFKAVWSQACYDGETLTDGGYCIWGQYEAIMDQGMSGGVHEVWAQASPAGFGAYKN